MAKYEVRARDQFGDLGIVAFTSHFYRRAVRKARFYNKLFNSPLITYYATEEMPCHYNTHTT